MKEAELQKLVMRHARANSWNVAHFGNSVKFIRRGKEYLTIPDKDATGFPDLVLVREQRLIFAELKSDKGRIRDEQALWLADLNQIADKSDAFNLNLVEVFVWRPAEWLDGSIQEVLA